MPTLAHVSDIQAPSPTSHPILIVQYDALCIRLIALLNAKIETSADLNFYLPLIEQTLERALILNMQLAAIYKCSGVHSVEQQNQLVNQGKKLLFFKNSLKDPLQEQPLPPHEKQTTTPSPSVQKIRSNTREWNPFRFAFNRLRRIFLTLPPAIKSFSFNSDTLSSAIQRVDKIVGPFLNYLGCVFLIPRLLANLVELARHLILPQGLETTLSWQERLQLQWQERWFELANDVIWVPGNLLCGLFLLGPLAPVGLTLSISLFAWDIVTAAIRASLELHRIRTLLKEEENKLANLPKNSSGYLEQEQYIKALNNHFTYEKKRHALSIINTSLVTLFTAIALSFFIIHPIAPLLGACALFVTTIVSYILGKRLTKPQNKLTDPTTVEMTTTAFNRLLAHKQTFRSEVTPPKEFPSTSPIDSPKSPNHNEPNHAYCTHSI